MYSAVIVEPRIHKALLFVLKNFLENLSNEWNIIIFHGNLNKRYIKSLIDNKLSQYKGRISLVNLNIDNLTREEYSRLFVSNKNFYRFIPTETFLVFQTDTMIFPPYKNLINNFLKYDYVGAPWPHDPRNNGHNVGNGGLSLRQKSKMLEIMDKEQEKNLPEDVFFSCTTEVELYKPSAEEAKLFSIENIFSDQTFGCHQPWRLKDELFHQYPETKKLTWLNDQLPNSYVKPIRIPIRIPYNNKRYIIIKRNPRSLLYANKRYSKFFPKKINYQISRPFMRTNLIRFR
uniref:DUF5672 domain-containing protein n=1 Tax=viral metagenome TaxID=1070528 RepID=A0A6C0B8W0_9ZZZZ